VTGYEDYLEVKYEDALAAFETKKTEIKALQDDLLSIQSRLSDD
jgi:hypothetical protein